MYIPLAIVRSMEAAVTKDELVAYIRNHPIRQDNQTTLAAYPSPLGREIETRSSQFSVGDHVSVLAGRYQNDTGLIVRLEENAVVLFFDLTMKELKLPPSDLQRFDTNCCSTLKPRLDSMDQYQCGDLVQINAQTVGIIVRIDRDHFQVNLFY